MPVVPNLARAAAMLALLAAPPALAASRGSLPVPPIPPAQAPPIAPAAPPPAAAKPAPPAPSAPDNSKGTVTGLPLPRFAALRADEVNMRVGPGSRYPIEWVYKRRDLPVEIQREFDVWRLVRDPDGVRGWVQQATLVGRRTFIVTGTERTMRARPDDQARAVAQLMPGVIGRIRSCKQGAEWCEVEVDRRRGWLKRSEFWGTLPGEAVP